MVGVRDRHREGRGHLHRDQAEQYTGHTGLGERAAHAGGCE